MIKAATIIKATDQDPRLIRRLETVSVSDHLAEAKLALQAARDKAQHIIREAQARARVEEEEASQRGYEAGFRRGYEAGKQSGHAEAYDEAKEHFQADESHTLAALRETIDAYDHERRDLFIAAQQDVIRFAARLAERVTRQIAQTEPDAVKANVDAALALVSHATDLVIHINPEDRATIDRFNAELAAAVDASRSFTIVEDATITRGGCRLTTAEAEVDATIDTQIARIVDVMVPPKADHDADRKDETA
jgi:flagellar assembly protein FliH